MLHNSFTTSFGKLFSIFVLIFSLVILSAGCQKKAEQPEGEKINKDTSHIVTPEQPKADTTAKVDTTKKYPDLTGTWTGKFENHNSTLKISNQQDGNFTAYLTVSYREPMKKTISGKIKPDSTTISMRDDEKSRYEASYTAKLSNDMKKISGTAHFKVNGNDVSFTFTKK